MQMSDIPHLSLIHIYSVIGGWVIKYLAEYVLGHGTQLAEEGYFSTFIADGMSTELCFIIFSPVAYTHLTIFLDRKNTSHIGQGDVRLVLQPVAQEIQILSLRFFILSVFTKKTIPDVYKRQTLDSPLV